ncbi:hypothetical protein [Marinomonas sp. IMCC 4694]|uniref:hypothetical protein n=1 Tax=Marinomonas sp. IMCC 4694 TaxID=2605432 RepID=UPI0011E7BF7C|nr:hypothetical protein [Marinomonas sp. IMCC 4694]TYL47584.1 hypothetical protein FXV75_06245 [Marinomonas sp. IMCC 4694]
MSLLNPFVLKKRHQAILLCCLSHYALAEDTKHVTMSGFGRIVAGQLATEEANFRGYSNNVTARPNSLLGLQVNAYATDYLSFTAQGVLRTSEEETSKLDWLYATVQPDDNVSFKIGQLRTPLFMLSDVVDIGYAYQWITPPKQVYGAFIFPIFKGIDIYWGHSTDQLDTSLEVYYGKNDGEITLNNKTTDYEVFQQGGVIGSVRYNNFEFRASHHGGNADIKQADLKSLASSISQFGVYNDTVNSLSTKGVVKLTQLSVRYDEFNYFAALEWTQIRPELQTFIPKINSYYATVGYIFNPVTVHLTFAESQFDYNNFPTEISQALAGMSTSDPRYSGLQQIVGGLNQISTGRSTDQLKSWTVGARWDVKPKLALKADVTFIQGEEDDTALFDSIQSGFDRKTALYQVAMEWVF